MKETIINLSYSKMDLCNGNLTNRITMEVINVKKDCLKTIGYNSLEDWKQDPNHLYIGRNMSFYVKGAEASKWRNPYPVKKYGLDECLKLYEQHIRSTDLYNQLPELKGKVLGCWCKPNACHGDVLIKLLNEK